MVHEKVFEADPNIQYTYAWDRLNEYRQVSVFYVYFDRTDSLHPVGNQLMEQVVVCQGGFKVARDKPGQLASWSGDPLPKCIGTSPSQCPVPPEKKLKKIN